ncbi:MAG: serine/threonine-protein kinase [Nannocystaceae bacterium]
MAQAGAQPEPSHRVGDFVLRRWLAQGGMAELYLATPADPARAREVVVLKRVLPQFSRSENFGRMFAREARLASMLRHPNIVQVDEAAGQDPAHPDPAGCFFTMEYVHGVDLAELLDTIRERGGALPLAHALTIAVAMCAGLHYAHEARGADGQPLGIVHRDVSPSNVLLSFDGQIKVTDFGVATALAMTRLTEEGTRKGKLSYMSPEQATGETVDRRADVFAIATVLYELTTMQRLFGGDNDLAVMYNILHRGRPSPREANPGYPAALESIVMQGVSHDPTERFATALQLQQALEGFAASVGLTLSTAALAEFIRSTVPVPRHPSDDPTLWTSSMRPRTASHHAVTIVDGSEPRSNPGAWPAQVTGAIAGLAAGSATVSRPGHGPVAAYSARHPISASSSQPWSGVEPAAPASGSGLRLLSTALAGLALLVAIGVGVLVWRAQSAPSPSSSAPASTTPPETAPPTAPSPTPSAQLPAAATQPTPTAVPGPPATATDPAAAPPSAEPSSPRRSKKSRKKRAKAPAPKPADTPANPTPAPTADPPSTKPAPTDTLLPIRE